MPPPSGAIQILDSYERPEFAAESAWRSSVTRTALRGAVTGYVIRGPLCTLVGIAGVSGLGIIRTEHPSFPGARVGAWSEVVIPLSASNCATVQHGWAEVTAPGTLTLGSATLTVSAHAHALPASPAIPLLVEISQSYLQSGHFGGYGGQEALLAKLHGDVLQAHRLAAMKSWVVYPQATSSGALDLSGPIGFQATVLDRTLGGPVSFPNAPDTVKNGVEVTPASAVEVTTRNLGLTGRSFFYSVDEPADAAMADPAGALHTLLTQQKTQAPSVLRMVTKHRNPAWPVDPLIDVYAPVINDFDNAYDTRTYPGPAAYAGKRVWLYPSCVSNGCTTCDGEVEGRQCYGAGTDRGTPDLVLDRPGVHAFALYGVALKYAPTVSALLYYNAVELERLRDARPWQNPWAFGGNLDGQLQFALRPGEYAMTAHLAAASWRQKALRQASHFADVMTLLRTQDPAWVQAKVAALVQGVAQWERNADVWKAAEAEALSRLR